MRREGVYQPRDPRPAWTTFRSLVQRIAVAAAVGSARWSVVSMSPVTAKANQPIKSEGQDHGSTMQRTNAFSGSGRPMWSLVSVMDSSWCLNFQTNPADDELRGCLCRSSLMDEENRFRESSASPVMAYEPTNVSPSASERGAHVGSWPSLFIGKAGPSHICPSRCFGYRTAGFTTQDTMRPHRAGIALSTSFI